MFKEQLKKIRLKRGLSQSQLADKLKVGKSTISMYESGKREPNFEMLEAIADVLNVNLHFLMGDENPDFTQVEPLLPNETEAMMLYRSLDSEDQAEIRGEMRGMLRAEKYKKNAEETA